MPEEHRDYIMFYELVKAKPFELSSCVINFDLHLNFLSSGWKREMLNR